MKIDVTEKCSNCEFQEKELHQLRMTVVKLQAVNMKPYVDKRCAELEKEVRQLQADLKFVREKSKELLEAHQGRIRSLLRKYEASQPTRAIDFK